MKRSRISSILVRKYVRLLLDTHVFLWAMGEPEQLPKRMRREIESSANEVYVSAVVGWEIAMKHAIGKLPLPMHPSAYVLSRLKRSGFLELPITLSHALAVSDLPAYHADPFDRLLIAQAQIEGMALASVDTQIAKYAVKVLRT